MRLLNLLICLVLTCILGCASIESAFKDKDEKKIPISQVPTEAVEAAQSAVKGIILTEAEIEEQEGITVYELEGMANGIEYEIEVTADGKVLDVEQEDEDDNNHDD